MTAELLISFISDNQRIQFIVLISIPLFVFIISWIHGVYDGYKFPWRHLYVISVFVSTFLLWGVLTFLVLLAVSDGIMVFVNEGVLLGTVFLSWLITVLCIKRSIDFERVGFIRGIGGFSFSWLISWIVGFAFYQSGFWFVQNSPVYTSCLVSVTVFLLVSILRSVSGRRLQ